MCWSETTFKSCVRPVVIAVHLEKTVYSHTPMRFIGNKKKNQISAFPADVFTITLFYSCAIKASEMRYIAH